MIDVSSNDKKTTEMDALIREKLQLEARVKDIDVRISELRWGTGQIKIDLEREVFLLFHETSIGGSRALNPNEFRISEIGHCSHELYYSKIYETGQPPKAPSTMKSKVTGVVSISNGVATVGTIIHEFVQKGLIKKFGPNRIKAERVIHKRYKVTWEGKEMVIEISGHVDLDYPHGTHEQLADIKTTTKVNFEKILGMLPCGAEEYAALKVQANYDQVNAYAVQSGHDGRECDIIWVSQANLDFKLEPLKVEQQDFNDILCKLARVLETVEKYKDGDENARPLFEGVANCSVCQHHNIHCLGKDAVAGGQTTLNQFVPPAGV